MAGGVGREPWRAQVLLSGSHPARESGAGSRPDCWYRFCSDVVSLESWPRSFWYLLVFSFSFWHLSLGFSWWHSQGGDPRALPCLVLKGHLRPSEVGDGGREQWWRAGGRKAGNTPSDTERITRTSGQAPGAVPVLVPCFSLSPPSPHPSLACVSVSVTRFLSKELTPFCPPQSLGLKGIWPVYLQVYKARFISV